MKTTFTRILTDDHIELAGLIYEPDQATKKILVHVHGMAGNFYENKFLDYIAKTLTDQGIAFFAFNNRGCECIKDLFKVEGDSRSIVTIGNAFERFEDCLLDIKSAIDFVENKDFTEIHLSGHSLAGPKVAYYAAESNKGNGDPRIASVIFLSPADMVGLAKADKDSERDISMAKQMVAEGKGNELLPFIVWGDARLSANTYMNLGDESSKVAIFNFYNPADELILLGKINVPSLTVIGKQDHVLIIPIDAMLARIKNAMTSSPKVQAEILGDADHGFINYEQQLADVLCGWIHTKE